MNKRIRCLPALLKGNKGLTMLEIQIALLIFTIELLAVADLLVILIRGNYLTKNIATATFLGESVVEEFNSKEYKDWVPIGTVLQSNINGEGEGGGIFSRVRTIEIIDIDGDGTLDPVKRIKVQISWVDKIGNHMIKLERLKSD